MGRLFWKFLLGFWAALIAVVVLISALFLFLRWINVDPLPYATRDRAEFMIGTISNLLDRDPEAARSLLASWQNSNAVPLVFVVDGGGHDLIGRPLPPDALKEAIADAAPGKPSSLMRHAGLVNGSPLIVFVRSSDVRAASNAASGPGGPPIFAPLLTAAVISLLASGLLAWNFAKPIRNLRWALHAVAAGRLETRVQPLMGNRRDEIADLGQDFDRMAGRLQQLVGAQRLLLHDVSHELRSPLARMQVAVGLARQQPERAADMMDRVERESGRLDALVGELLALTRLEAGVEDAPREQVDVVELVASVAEDARFEALNLNRDLLLKAEGVFYANVGAELICRAVENLMRNAVKYTPEGTTVDVALLADAEQLTIRVMDRGPGTLESEFASMFEPFHRLGQDGSEGTGLGLAIAKRAIDAHGGTIVPMLRHGGGLIMQIVLTREGLAQARSQGSQLGKMEPKVLLEARSA